MNSPSVIAIVPTITVDDYFVSAVNSLRGQTYPNIKIVVVADGPVRDPSGVLEAPDLTVVQLPRRSGTAAALNAGLAAAESEYIVRLDADDIASPERVQRQVEALVQTGADLVASGARLIDQSGSVIGEVGEGLYGDELLSALTRANPIVHSSVIFRRSIVTGVGGYDPACRRMQDYELWLRLALAGASMHVLPERLVDYRLHPSQNSQRAEEILASLTRIVRHRSALRTKLGKSRVLGFFRDYAWFGWQWLRLSRVVRPRYLAGLAK